MKSRGPVLRLIEAAEPPERIAESIAAGESVWLDPGESAAGRVAAVVRALIERGVEVDVAAEAATGVAGRIRAAGGVRRWLAGMRLAGQRIVVTRAQAQAGDLAALLEAAGAEAIELPTIAIQPAADTAPLDAAIARLDTYDWLIFTSVNGVHFFLERLDASPGRDLRSLRARICAIGPATRDALLRAHLKVDRMPPEYVAESLLETFSGDDVAGARILLPRAKVARDLVPVELARRGAMVDVVEAYRTVTPPDAPARLAALLAGERRPDWITFTSSSTVHNFVALAGGAAGALAGIRLASIGPVTSATAREYGLTVTTEAAEHTVPGLVAALISGKTNQP